MNSSKKTTTTQVFLLQCPIGGSEDSASEAGGEGPRLHGGGHQGGRQGKPGQEQGSGIRIRLDLFSFSGSGLVFL